ncbi:MBOAT family O-acyltransferase [Bacteroides faecium]|uniref:MBOAT family protein n=1 Tax=Bacteroides faecium TaxID=2715212 RepID=A0A6H0KUL0_9BACE|nr:MBOAT family protein [Bacteroides faecium]
MPLTVIVISLLFFYATGITWRKVILILTSLYVYYQFIGVYILLLLILSTIIIISSKFIVNENKKIFVIIPILFIIFTFAILKYTGFSNWKLPVGFSVYAFSSISFIVDQYKNHIKYKWLDILCFLYFFPKILAGPIERSQDFISQLSTINKPTLIQFYKVFKLIVFSTLCKFVIANNLEGTTTSDYNGVNTIISILLFSIQFYFDYWAYTNFAIAFGWLYGIKLSPSFNRPYYSNSFKKFWNCWNITLSTWLRDYIYIPLGGNKVKRLHWISNILIVFIVSGLWHGSTVPFIIWGITHAILLIIELTIIKRYSFNLGLLYGIFVFLAVSLLWQMFKCNNLEDIASLFKAIKTPDSINIQLIVYLSISLTVMVILQSKTVLKIIFSIHDNKKFIIYEVTTISIMIIFIILLCGDYNSTFFYFKF